MEEEKRVFELEMPRSRLRKGRRRQDNFSLTSSLLNAFAIREMSYELDSTMFPLSSPSPPVPVLQTRARLSSSHIPPPSPSSSRLLLPHERRNSRG
eukprot:99218-Hanusia_phi.AAC.1